MNIVVVGGCGHVGLPLGVKFALSGFQTTLVDIDKKAVDTVNSGSFPFLELGGSEQLKIALNKGLIATTSTENCKTADAIVFVIGTPVDEHLNPKLSDVIKIFDHYLPLLKDDALVIMRSTLFPGTMEHLKNRISELSKKTDKRFPKNLLLSFCPERVAQGYALDEIDSLPQIVSAFDDKSFNAALNVFNKIAPKIIRLEPMEAELTKLMANSWRYLEFAIANQFYMIAESKGLDFFKIYEAIRHDYPRAKGYKSPGLSAGPCLFKDTMQLASFFDHQFYMGHSAMLVNEGLAGFLVDKLINTLSNNTLSKSDTHKNLWGKKVGLLGMTFKADNDDIRESLSYRIRKALEFKGAEILLHDPYLEESNDLDTILTQCDGVIIGTPHREYKNLKFKMPVIDVWGNFNKNELEVYDSPNSTSASSKKVSNL